MKFLEQKIDSLKFRRKCFSYGIYFLKSSDFRISDKLQIDGKRIDLKFVDRKNSAFIYEFKEICIHDCYRLNYLKKYLKKVNTIVDIGANQGLFSLAARQTFPKAKITAYEPNKNLVNYLGHNANALDVSVYYEAVTKNDCRVQLLFGDTDLNTQAIKGNEGDVKGTAFREVLARAGGHIDILKIDCEGGEWEILDTNAGWENVGAITMEYHLWARKGSSSGDIFKMLEKLQFKVLVYAPLAEDFGLIVAAKNL